MRILAASALLLAMASQAHAQSIDHTYVFNASCYDSHIKQGRVSDDLTTVQGQLIHCDKAVISFLPNGHKVVTVVDSQSDGRQPIFAGDAFGYELAHPHLLVMPIKRVYRETALQTTQTATSSGVQGACFMDGTQDVPPHDLACSAMIRAGDRKIVYSLNVKLGEMAGNE